MCQSRTNVLQERGRINCALLLSNRNQVVSETSRWWMNGCCGNLRHIWVCGVGLIVSSSVRMSSPNGKSNVPREPVHWSLVSVVILRCRRITPGIPATIIITVLVVPIFRETRDHVFEREKVVSADGTWGRELKQPRIHTRLVETVLALAREHAHVVSLLEIHDTYRTGFASDRIRHNISIFLVLRLLACCIGTRPSFALPRRPSRPSPGQGWFWWGSLVVVQIGARGGYRPVQAWGSVPSRSIPGGGGGWRGQDRVIQLQRWTGQVELEGSILQFNVFLPVGLAVWTQGIGEVSKFHDRKRVKDCPR